MLKSNKIKWKREQKKAVFSKKYIFPHNKHMVLIHTKKNFQNSRFHTENKQIIYMVNKLKCLKNNG